MSRDRVTLSCLEWRWYTLRRAGPVGHAQVDMVGHSDSSLRGDMDVTWLGHSCLRIRSGAVTVITDPYAESVGFGLKKQKADIVTVSHDHPHHAYVDAIEGEPRVLRGPGEYEVASFYIVGTATRRRPSEEHGDDLVNTIFTFRAEGLVVCHLGDLAETLPARLADNLGQPDVLIVPAGGKCTLPMARVADTINLLGPRLVVPVHYGVEGLGVELEPVAGLYTELGLAAETPQTRLSVTSSNLPRETQIVQLQRSAA